MSRPRRHKTPRRNVPACSAKERGHCSLDRQSSSGLDYLVDAAAKPSDSMSAHELPRPQKPQYRAVIVSPHYDDAVYSCAGSIARWVCEGAVLVVNVFTRYLADVRFRGVVANEARQAEELSAASALGYESVALNELDAIFRRPEYKQLSNLFRRPTPEDLAWMSTLHERLGRLLDAIDYEVLLLPMAVGWHVDHVLCSAFVPKDVRRVRYYEDLPYAILPHTTRLRLYETGGIGDAGVDTSLMQTSRASDWCEVASAYYRTAMMQNLRPAIVRWFAYPVVGLYLRKLVRSHQAPETEVPALGAWHAVIQESGLQVEAKSTLMALYRSQFSEFFESHTACAAAMAAHAARFTADGGFAERQWQRSNAPHRSVRSSYT